MNHPTNQPDNNCPTGSTAAAPSADTAQQHQQQQPCPDWLHLCAELKEEACWKDQWEQLGSFAEGEHKATYQAQSFVRELYGYRLRFVVVHSDQLEALQKQTMKRRIEKTERGSIAGQSAEARHLRVDDEPYARGWLTELGLC